MPKTLLLALGLLMPGAAAALDERDACDRAVYRAASVSFLKLVVMSGEAVQPVQITDRDGAVWVAYYGMQRQEDGRWQTNACRLVQPNRTISA